MIVSMDGGVGWQAALVLPAMVGTDVCVCVLIPKSVLTSAPNNHAQHTAALLRDGCTVGSIPGRDYRLARMENDIQET